MAEVIKCRLCEWQVLVSDEDPDATMDDAVQHAMRRHGAGPLQTAKSLGVLMDAPHA